MKKIVRLTESDLTRIVRRVINEQQSVDIKFIINQSDNDKMSDTFCKSKSEFDICLVEKSMDRNTLTRKYTSKKNILQTNGYSMSEESGLRQSTNGDFIKSSTWKKV